MASGVLPGLVVLFALCAVLYPPLSMPAAIGVLLVGIRLRGRARGLVLGLGGPLALVAFGRFVVLWAVPNIVGSGQKGAEEKALSRLREIAWAERRAHAAASRYLPLAQLFGAPGRPLQGAFQAAGPDALKAEGYLFSADASPDGQRFVAYAWPVEEHGGHHLFVTDERERFCVRETGAPYGPTRPPAPDAALDAAGELSCTDRAAVARDGARWLPYRRRRGR